MREYKSRLSEVEEQKSIKTATIFGGLTILVIIIALVFGIPLFSKFLSLFNKNTSTNQASQNTVLLPPVLSPLPENTNQQSIIVKGTATSNSKVKIFFGTSANESDEAVADTNGNFASNIALTKGVNTIYAVTIDSNENTSDKSTVYTVNFTNKVPSLTINIPQNNQNFYGSAQQNLTIQGLTDAGNSVTINDHIAIVDTNGKFNFPITLQNGDNQLKIVSTDPAGNKKEIDLKVTFNP